MIPEYQTVLTEIIPAARDTFIFRFTKPNNWNFVAGQFLSLKFTEKAFRAYSIASKPTDDFIELVVRLIEGGLGSEALRVAKIGQKFMFRGAFGMMKLSETKNAPQIFCATGTGIAPFRSMILTELESENPRPMVVLYGGTDAKDLAYLSELSELVGVKTFFGLSRESDLSELEKFSHQNSVAKKCRITQFLEQENFGDLAEFYICGNGPMVLSVREFLDQKGIEKKRIHQERFN